MGVLRRAALAVVSTSALVGCALLSGAGDLTVADGDGGGGGGEAGAVVGPDGSVASDGSDPGADGGVGPGDGAPADATPPPTDGGDGGTRLRDVTFEDGTVLGVHGGDSMFGIGVLLATGLNALSGKDSLRVDHSASGILVGFAPVSELYATCLVKYENIDLTYTTSFTFVPEASGVPAEVHASSQNNAIELFVGGSLVGSGGFLKMGQTLRLGFHLRQDATSSFVELFMADKGAALGTPIVSAHVTNLGRTAGVRMGVLDTSGNNKATFDDLLLDTAALPP